MSRQAVPDSDEMARLIQAAFEALPAPDEERLADIESRLSGQLKQPRGRRRLHWGWLLLLAGAAATAAWWAGETLFPGQERQPRKQERNISIDDNSPAAPVDKSRAENSAEVKRRNGEDNPVIYRREAQ